MLSLLALRDGALRPKFFAAFLCVITTIGCGPAEVELPCGGHGEMHGDHCHCDGGYALSDDGQTCVVAPADHGGGDQGGAFSFIPRNPRAATGAARDGTQVWLLEAVDGDKVLEMAIYEAYGGPTSPTDIEMTEDETRYSTCGTCLVLRTGCIAHNGHFDCLRSFMPRAEGTIFLDELGAQPGGRLSGEMVDLVFQEVVIIDRGRTTVVTDGAVLDFDPWTFDLPLGSLGGGGGGAQEECSGHGRLHGDHCDCDPGYRPDPQNPMACIPV